MPPRRRELEQLEEGPVEQGAPPNMFCAQKQTPAPLLLLPTLTPRAAVPYPHHTAQSARGRKLSAARPVTAVLAVHVYFIAARNCLLQLHNAKQWRLQVARAGSLRVHTYGHMCPNQYLFPLNAHCFIHFSVVVFETIINEKYGCFHFPTAHFLVYLSL